MSLLFAIIRHKTEDDYMNVFGKLKEVLQPANMEEVGDEPHLRVIVDFETAAIEATRRVFLERFLEGCGWQVSQPWMKKRSTFGFLRFLRKREEKEPRVVRWWRTLKCMLFLPKDMLQLVNDSRTPSLEEEHRLCGPCNECLGCLRNT
ncbi:hypothetical protein Aduo_002600 [Ancylostoma duodenale]